MGSYVILIIGLLFVIGGYIKHDFAGISFGIILIIYFSIAKYKENQKEQEYTKARTTPPTSPQEPDQSAVQELTYLKHQLIVERFNKFYGLGLFDGDIYEISHDTDPFEKLAEYVTPGAPSFEEAYITLTKTISNLIHSIICSTEKATEIEKSFFDFLNVFLRRHSATEIFEFYTLEEKNCPPDCLYLVGKINYFFLSLELLATYAEENEDEYLLSKCEELIELHRPVI
ncbi:MAG: hypothetical protein IKC97_01680 [Clostridia bacterium]|nr:hypothetical protein [Clostridia bacterium]